LRPIASRIAAAAARMRIAANAAREREVIRGKA
jgi:hypothetical protein